MIDALAVFARPEAWAALATLIVLEVVLGIDNLIFISILSNKLPAGERTRARRVGISLALVLRLVLSRGSPGWSGSPRRSSISAFTARPARMASRPSRPLSPGGTSS